MSAERADAHLRGLGGRQDQTEKQTTTKFSAVCAICKIPIPFGVYCPQCARHIAAARHVARAARLLREAR